MLLQARLATALVLEQAWQSVLKEQKKIKEFLWYKNKPINYNLDSAPNSQDLPDYFSPTFGVIIVNREAMLDSKNYICSNPYFYEISERESTEIDTELDFEFSEFLYNKYIYYLPAATPPLQRVFSI